jgi:hypothetical protein
VGKTYLFECPQCQYQARISGGADAGLHCEIQTVICRDCRQLYDVFTRQRRRADTRDFIRFPGFYRPEIPPTVLGQSSVTPATKPLAPLVWRDMKPACPVEPKHFVEPWNDPGRCHGTIRLPLSRVGLTTKHRAHRECKNSTAKEREQERILRDAALP